MIQMIADADFFEEHSVQYLLPDFAFFLPTFQDSDRSS